MESDEVINAYRTWDGRAYLLSHLEWLKGSYQMAQVRAIMPENPDAKIHKPKGIPHRNPKKSERRFMLKVLGIRQLKRHLRYQNTQEA